MDHVLFGDSSFTHFSGQAHFDIEAGRMTPGQRLGCNGRVDLRSAQHSSLEFTGFNPLLHHKTLRTCFTLDVRILSNFSFATHDLYDPCQAPLAKTHKSGLL